MRKKKPIVLENILVTDYAAEGKSLARVDGKVIFIERAVPGDIVDVRLSKSKKDWAEGYVSRFIEYSQERVEPFCQHFGVCGGCQWQMLPYEKQLEYKQRQVSDAMQRIGHVTTGHVYPIAGAIHTRRYRNKLEYTFGTREFIPDRTLFIDTNGSAGVAGFHARGHFDKVVSIETCHLQPEPTNAIRLAVRDFALRHGLSFYDIREQRGWLRTMQVRICTTGEIMVNVVFGHESELDRKALLDHLLAEFPQITTLLYTINTKLNDSLYDLEPVTYFGQGFVHERLEEFVFKVGPLSFFQTNTGQAETLYQITREFAGLTGSETVYDLYCGTGSIGIFLSKGAGRIIGVETVGAAVADAQENAASNGIEHASFFEGDVIKVCTDEFFATHGRPDVIVTDPPRAGMHEKLVSKIIEIEAPTVVYVSCNPATQARDLAAMADRYEVVAMQAVDMFPQTLHIENVAKLRLRP